MVFLARVKFSFTEIEYYPISQDKSSINDLILQSLHFFHFSCPSISSIAYNLLIPALNNHFSKWSPATEQFLYWGYRSFLPQAEVEKLERFALKWKWGREKMKERKQLQAVLSNFFPSSTASSRVKWRYSLLWVWGQPEVIHLKLRFSLNSPEFAFCYIT